MGHMTAEFKFQKPPIIDQIQTVVHDKGKPGEGQYSSVTYLLSPQQALQQVGLNPGEKERIRDLRINTTYPEYTDYEFIYGPRVSAKVRINEDKLIAVTGENFLLETGVKSMKDFPGEYPLDGLYSKAERAALEQELASGKATLFNYKFTPMRNEYMGKFSVWYVARANSVQYLAHTFDSHIDGHKHPRAFTKGKKNKEGRIELYADDLPIYTLTEVQNWEEFFQTLLNPNEVATYEKRDVGDETQKLESETQLAFFGIREENKMSPLGSLNFLGLPLRKDDKENGRTKFDIDFRDVDTQWIMRHANPKTPQGRLAAAIKAIYDEAFVINEQIPDLIEVGEYDKVNELEKQFQALEVSFDSLKKAYISLYWVKRERLAINTKN